MRVDIVTGLSWQIFKFVGNRYSFEAWTVVNKPEKR